MMGGMSLYPLKFKPRFVEKIWGGRKLQSVLGKNLPPEKLIGESWELYDDEFIRNLRSRIETGMGEIIN